LGHAGWILPGRRGLGLTAGDIIDAIGGHQPRWSISAGCLVFGTGLLLTAVTISPSPLFGQHHRPDPNADGYSGPAGSDVRP
jgi:hypothetical protein